MTSAIDSTSLLSDYSITAQTSTVTESELGQDEFMTLMLEQLRNQDPLDPAENGEFIAQIAQFSTVTGIDEMNDNITALADNLTGSQALQAANLVGRDVMIPTDTFTLDEEGSIEGVYELYSSAGSTNASIFNAAGELVHQIDLGVQSAGQNRFSWDGLLADGSRAAPGSYSITINDLSSVDAEAAEVSMLEQVESVNFSAGSGGITINTAGGQSLSFADVTQIF
ncbi:flagellar hook assembly protein FlgD [Granulosicoccaceae sp. 1_MG-2023]|nr:flagellar hook assembly protein FlgD [Granulosicoccaceae sp. 1_MG-2023]